MALASKAILVGLRYGVTAAYPMVVAVKRGERITVKFGGFGTQMALVVADTAHPHTFVRVIKYRANSGRWTKPVLMRCDAVVQIGWPSNAQARRAVESL